MIDVLTAKASCPACFGLLACMSLAAAPLFKLATTPCPSVALPLQLVYCLLCCLDAAVKLGTVGIRVRQAFLCVKQATSILELCAACPSPAFLPPCCCVALSSP